MLVTFEIAKKYESSLYERQKKFKMLKYCKMVILNVVKSLETLLKDEI